MRVSRGWVLGVWWLGKVGLLICFLFLEFMVMMIGKFFKLV